MKRTDLKLKEKKLYVSKLKKNTWDGRSIDVHGLYPGINNEMLTMIFEHKKKSGGGPIEEVGVGKNSAFIRFVSKQGRVL